MCNSFLLMLAPNISQYMRLWKVDVKNVKMPLLFELDPSQKIEMTLTHLYVHFGKCNTN